MELVFLWVEEYKNIQRQGFNFSPRFHCKYDPYTNELTINKNEDYISDFFGENINVTAIVGKNGSGKSGLSEAILLGSSRFYNNRSKVKIFSIFEERGKFFLNTYSNKTLNMKVYCLKGEIYLNSLRDLDIFTLHSSNAIDSFSSDFCNNIQENTHCGFMYDLETTPPQKNFFSFPDKNNGIIDLNKINLLNNKYMLYIYEKIGKEKIKNLLNTLDNDYNSNLCFTPDKFKLHFDFYETYLKFIKNENYQKILKIYFSNNRNITNSRLNKGTLQDLTSLYIMFRLKEIKVGDLFDKVNDNYINNESLVFLLRKFEDIILDIERFDKQIYNSELDNEEYLEDEKTSFIQNELSNISNNLIDIFNDVKEIDLLIGKSIKSLFYDIYTAMKYLHYILYEKDNFEYFYRKTPVLHHLEFLAELPYYIECELWMDHESDIDINFSALSYGEKVINRMFYSLFYFSENIKNKEYKNLIILFDEIENGLHPQWQRKFINFIHRILSILIDEEMFYFINFVPITHSPFLLSDIPRQNIIFLDTDREENEEGKSVKIGNCVVSGLHDKQETFGQNIHTLISDSFFMKDGLMGEFAKKKIQEIIDYLNDKKNIEEISTREEHIKKVIESIGEPFLKQKLFEMYYKKFEDESLIKARKDELLSEKERIERELEKYD